MILIVGNRYKKTNFGIRGIVMQWSEITVEGELFTFFSIDSKYKNEVVSDGFVYEDRGEYALIPYNKQIELHRQVFYRKASDEDYTYLGRGKYEIRHDEKHNKIFW